MVDVERRWNHNIHYHPVILAALFLGCGQVLDVGCGEGVLAAELSRVARRVTAIDRDGPTIDRAREHTAADNIDYIVDDVLVRPFELESFDAVVSVAAIHHIGTTIALRRMQELLRPGGRLAVVGLTRSRYPSDLLYDLAGTLGTRLHRLTKTYWETSAPKVWPPPETYRQLRQAAIGLLPGSATGAASSGATR